MKFRNVTVSLLIATAAVGSAFSEDDDPPPASTWSVEASVTASKGVELETSGQPAGEMDAREFAVEIEHERRFGEERPRILKIGLELTRGKFSGLPINSIMPDDLSSVGIETSLTTVHNDRWLTIFALTPGWRTAGSDRPDSGGFGVQGLALARYAATENLDLWFGAYGDSLALSGDQIVPLFGVDWSFAPRWRLSLGIPRSGVLWALSETLELGLQANLTSDAYAIAEDFRQQYGLTDEVRLDYFDVRAGLQLQWRFHPHGSLTLGAGTILARRLDIEGDFGRYRLKADGAGGGYGSVNLTFRF